MRKKTLFLTAAVLVAGMIAAVAQSNPGSTNGTDVEMQLAWPDAITYINGLNDVDTAIFLGTAYGTDAYYDRVNWQETTGGTGESKETVTIPSSWFSGDDYQYYWLGGRLPEFGNGYYVSLPDGGTNVTSSPAPGSTTTGYGSVNFVSSDGNTTYRINDQGQVALITGGEPGVTGSELYAVSGGAMAYTYTDQMLPSGSRTGVSIPSQQIQIGSLGNLNTNGILWVVLPTHTQVPVTPHANAPYYQAGVSAQGYRLVSQCVATTPANQVRTTIGVGEQVNLSFNPTLPTNAVWRTTAGGLSVSNGTTTQLTAPSNAANVTVTATVFGKSITKTFNVVEPKSYAFAQLTGPIHYSTGTAGVGMTNLVFIGPTSVSFYRVSLMEVGEDATNMSGYFTQWTPQDLRHNTADFWFQLNVANEFQDVAEHHSYPSPWSVGSFMWDIPVKWCVTGSGVTNSMRGWNQKVSIDASGTMTVQKFGHSATRTINDVITTK